MHNAYFHCFLSLSTLPGFLFFTTGIFAFIASELVQDHQLRKKLQRGFQQMGGIPKTECGETTTMYAKLTLILPIESNFC